MALCHSTPDKRRPCRLGFDHPDRGLVDVEEVVRPPVARLLASPRGSQTPRAAKRFIAFLSCTDQPASLSWRSIRRRALASAGSRLGSSPGLMLEGYPRRRSSRRTDDNLATGRANDWSMGAVVSGSRTVAELTEVVFGRSMTIDQVLAVLDSQATVVSTDQPED